MAKAKILVIDDYMDTRKVMVNFLTENGDYKLLEASDGGEGAKIFHSWHPDIVIVDLGIAVIRGEELVRLIKDSHSKTKVIVLGGNYDLDREPVVMAAGCDIFLKKPFHLLILQKEVEKLLRVCLTCR